MKLIERGWIGLVLACSLVAFGCGDDNGGIKADSGSVDTGETRLDTGTGTDGDAVGANDAKEVNKDLPGPAVDTALDRGTPPDAVDVAADASGGSSADASVPDDVPGAPDVPLAQDDAGPDSPIVLVVDAAQLDATSDIDGAVTPAVDAGVDAGGTDAEATFDSAGPADVGIDAATTVEPTAEAGVFTFQSAGVSFAVDSTKGARIVTYSLSGTNVVTTPASDSNNYGSTFWPSPQSAWNWPPPADVDSGAYTGGFASGALTLTSATSASLGLAVRKQFTMDSRAGDVVVRYALLNQGTSARAYAPWEITRVAPSGIVFFPMGSGGPRKGSQDLLSLTISDDIAWFAYDANVVTADQKVFADGAEGWIAHVDGGLVFIKSFADISLAEAAPSEAEIEIFANAAHTYVEVENQGAYAAIDPSEVSTWDVGWFVRAVPASIPVAVGSEALVDFVRDVVAGH